jgi:hypothetical protein
MGAIVDFERIGSLVQELIKFWIGEYTIEIVLSFYLLGEVLH